MRVTLRLKSSESARFFNHKSSPRPCAWLTFATSTDALSFLELNRDADTKDSRPPYDVWSPARWFYDQYYIPPQYLAPNADEIATANREMPISKFVPKQSGPEEINTAIEYIAKMHHVSQVRQMMSERGRDLAEEGRNLAERELHIAEEVALSRKNTAVSQKGSAASQKGGETSCNGSVTSSKGGITR